MEALRDIFGDESEHHPLKQEYINLTSSPEKLSVEARLRTRKLFQRFLYQVKLFLLSFGGRHVLKHKTKTATADWGDYVPTLIKNTDYRKVDEALRMVLAGSKAQTERLRAVLENMKSDGKLIFGLHSSKKALITCIVTNYNKDHVHFLDGADGGYALAALELKKQRQSLLNNG